MPKDSERLCELSINHPSGWDIDQFRANWFVFLEALLKEEASLLIPARRIRSQIEQTPTFQEVVSGWDSMKGSHRLEAWKRLLLAAEDACRTILPACVQCGECCRMGSPTLHLEDLPLLQSGKIPWDQLITLRKGEPARSPFDGRLFVLPEDRIKVREKEGHDKRKGTALAERPQHGGDPSAAAEGSNRDAERGGSHRLRECILLISETDRCSIYSDRPLQCRAQACWDPIPARETAELPFLLREHIFEGVDPVLEIIAEHESRCGFGALSAAFEELSRSNGENVQEVLGLLSYEEHFRQFVSERFKIPPQNMELLLGRSFAQMTALFGFRVSEEPDGTLRLLADKPVEQA